MRVCAVMATVLLILAAARPAVADGIAVIVHADRETALDLEALAQIYLKRRRFWRSGEPIVPVNREASSRSREVFRRAVLGVENTQLVVYWNREYFRGVLPPATLASDEAIRRFVARNPRAIGYVDPTIVDDSVRVVLSID